MPWYTHKEMLEKRPIPVGTKVIVRDVQGDKIGILDDYDHHESWCEENSISIRYEKEPRFVIINGYKNYCEPLGCRYFKKSKPMYKRFDEVEYKQLSLFEV